MYAKTRAIITRLAEESDRERLCIVRHDHYPRELAKLVMTGELVSPWRGMYADAEQWASLKPPERQRRIVRTLARNHPKWTFCSLTAALMYGLEVSYGDLMPIHCAVSPDCHTKSTDSIVRHVISGEEAVEVDGVRVTSFKRTVMDCLIGLDFRRGLAIADSALRLGLSLWDLIAYIKAKSDVLGWEKALDAPAWANPLAANGGESFARAVMIEQGFMVPQLQVKIPNLIEGIGSYYADFFWELSDGTQVAGELDGLDKYCDPTMTGGRSAARVMSEERRRESRLGAAGLKVVRFSFAEVEDVAKFSRLLEAYGIPRGPARPRGRTT